MFNKFIFCSLTISLCLFVTAANSADPNNIESDEILSFHAIHNEEIQEIMHRLTQALYNKEKDKSINDEIDIEHAHQIFDIASELYLAAGKLNEALPGFKLSEDEKNIFEGLARALQIEANKLAHMTENSEKSKVEYIFKRMDDTCAACHELFRF